jgi:WD40 repeat protein
LTSSPPLGRIGDYELIEEIARGGMGVVYKARQPGLGRIVAVKVILAGQFADKKVIQRFRGEMTTAGLLQHPNIVAVHDVGMHASQPFFSMDFVDGQNLAQLVGNRPLPAKKAATYVKLIAEAIHYAHEQGILHRDLKPSNVLIDTASDQPRVTDFGLAKRLDGESSLTLTGQMLGSPNFMPPEQASRGHGKVSRQSDVYGLGAILYHLITARAPFQADSLTGIVTQVVNSEPVPPRLLNSGVPRDLETVCLKCLQKEPARRYATAKELAQELGRFLAEEPILARAVGRAERVWRWSRRNPVIAGLVVALHLAFALGFAGVLWQWRRAEVNATNEAQARRYAEAESYTADMNLVLQVWEEGNLRRAQELLRKHVPHAGEQDLRGFEWRYLWSLCRDESRYAFTNFEHDIGALAFAPDSQFLAVGAGHVVKLLDVNSQKELGGLRVADANEVIYTLAFSPKSTNILAIAGELGAIRLCNLTTKEITNLAEHLSALPGGPPSDGGVTKVITNLANLSPVQAISFSPDGKVLAAAYGLAVSVWNIAEKKMLWTTNLAIPPNDVAFSPDGDALVSGGGGGNGNPRVWEVATGKELAPFPELHKGWVQFIAFCPDRRTLATSAADSQLILWDFAERRAKAQLIKQGGDVVRFSADGRLMACVGLDGMVRVWDVASQQLVTVLRSLDRVWALRFTPDGTRIVCAGASHTLRVWDMAGLTDKDTLKHKHWVHQVAFSPDANTLVSVDARDFSKVWDVPSRQLVGELPGGGYYGGGAAFSPDGQLFVTSSYSGKVLLWDTATLQARAALTNDYCAACVAFSPDGKVLGVASGFMTRPPKDSRSLAFWDVASGQKLNRLAEAGPDSAAVSFSKDGRLVAVGYHTGWVRLWDWESGTRVAEFHEHLGQVQTVAFSASGSLLASGGDSDENVVVYSVAPPRVLRVLEGHTLGVTSVAFAPDGKTLAAAGNDGTVRLWNLATYQPVLTLKKHTGIVVSIAFSRDGNFLASSGADGDVRLWPAASVTEVQPKALLTAGIRR